MQYSNVSASKKRAARLVHQVEDQPPEGAPLAMRWRRVVWAAVKRAGLREEVRLLPG